VASFGTGGNAGVQYNAATTVVENVAGILDAANNVVWSPQNSFGPSGAGPVGVATIPSSSPAVPFTLTSDTSGGSTGAITFDSATNTVTGAAGAAVPGATVFVSALGGTGGTAADAATATRKQATAAADGSVSIVLTTATQTTTVRLRQELQRTATETLLAAESAAIPAVPVTVLSTSGLENKSGGTAGTVESGDRIVLDLSRAVGPTVLGTSFNVVVSNATPNVVTIYRGGTDTTTVVATITFADGTRYNTGAGSVAYNDSVGTWTNSDTKLTITLGTQAGSLGSPVGTGADHALTIVADAGGEIASAPVIGTPSRF
jgi:hypothetical protein